jgi:transposase
MLPRYRYPSDTSDLEWSLLERLLPTPACQTTKGGAPEKWPRHRVVDAIRYVVDNGAKWRALPADFGIPWRTVFGYFARWAKADVLKRILDQLRRRLRLRGSGCALAGPGDHRRTVGQGRGDRLAGHKGIRSGEDDQWAEAAPDC